MMKKDSLIYKYKKAMKESENATNSEKRKFVIILSQNSFSEYF